MKLYFFYESSHVLFFENDGSDNDKLFFEKPKKPCSPIRVGPDF